MTSRLGTAAALAAITWTLLAAAASGYSTPAPPLRDHDYFRFADNVTAALEDTWDEGDGMYRTGARSIDTIANAAMLTVFATAAAHGHVGPARNDQRARLLVDGLTRSPFPYYTRAKAPYYDKMFHSPGWTSNMDGPYVDMDKSIDPKVAEGLQIAFRARDVLGLDPATVQRIQQQVHDVAHTRFFRYPLVRLNQINWPAELYAFEYLINGNPGLLLGDYRAHVRRFVAGFKRPWTREGSTNVGPTYRFHYQNNVSAAYSRNLDSAEYSNMTLHFLYWYELARRAGMRELPREDIRLLRGWVQRNLYGNWTHAGFMNWDTGWSYERWMKGKAWGYAQQGLLAIATQPRFNLRAAETRYAKHLFDRGLRLYEHLSFQPSGRPWRPSAMLFGIGEQGAPATRMFWARMAANAARAVSAGLGRMRSDVPPPMYSFDADIGRLAVSTPRYSTAILAVNRGKVPYGGTDLARLYDADGDPIGTTGGRPPGTFGVMLSRLDGHRTLATQTGLHEDPKRPAVILTRSPRGRADRVRRLATRPDAGPFSQLDSRGVRRGDGATVTTTHKFRRDFIRVRWRIVRSGPRTRRVRVTFPMSGGRSTRVEALLRDGRTVEVRRESRLRLREVRWLRLRSAFGSYRVVLLGRPRGRTGMIARHYDKSNPRGGKTLALELPRLRTGVRTLAVDIRPASSRGVRGDGSPDPADAVPLPEPTPTATAPAGSALP